MNYPNRGEEFYQLKELVKKGTVMIVGIDVAKEKNLAHFIRSDGEQILKRFQFGNSIDGYEKLLSHINSLKGRHPLEEVILGLEPTANYHKPLGEYLIERSYHVVLVSSSSAKKNRETLDERWDKNDPKDAANIADLIRQGKFLYYHIPDREIRSLRSLLSLRRKLKKLDHSFRMRIRGHLLAQYFPEADSYYRGLTGSINNVVRDFLSPSSIRLVSREEFIKKVGSQCTLPQKRKLKEVWEHSGSSVGCEVNDGARYEGQVLVHMLEEVKKALKETELRIKETCAQLKQFPYLLSIPGFGPIVSGMTLGAIGDPFRFKNAKQVLKMAGLDLSASRSGKGSLNAVPVISKKGTSELRYALYQAALIATYHNQEFRDYFTRILKGRERERGIKTKMRVKLAAKMLIIAWTLMKRKERFDPKHLTI